MVGSLYPPSTWTIQQREQQMRQELQGVHRQMAQNNNQYRADMGAECSRQDEQRHGAHLSEVSAHQANPDRVPTRHPVGGRTMTHRACKR